MIHCTGNSSTSSGSAFAVRHFRKTLRKREHNAQLKRVSSVYPNCTFEVHDEWGQICAQVLVPRIDSLHRKEHRSKLRGSLLLDSWGFVSGMTRCCLRIHGNHGECTSIGKGDRLLFAGVGSGPTNQRRKRAEPIRVSQGFRSSLTLLDQGQSWEQSWGQASSARGQI